MREITESPDSNRHKESTTVYVAGPTITSRAFCRLIGDLPTLTALPLSPSNPLSGSPKTTSPKTTPDPIPFLIASAAALLLISFGNADLLQSFLAALGDLPGVIDPPHIALMTNGLDSREITVAIDQGIRVFISADENLPSLQEALMAAVQGQPFCSVLLQSLVTAAQHLPRSSTQTISPERGSRSPLSRREWESATLVSQGYTDAEAAERLYISVYTVKAHLRSVFPKLGIRHRGQFPAALAGVTPPPKKSSKTDKK